MRITMTVNKKQNKERVSLIRQEVVVSATGSGPPKRGGSLKKQGEHTNILWNRSGVCVMNDFLHICISDLKLIHV